MHGPVSGASTCGKREYPNVFDPSRKSVNAAGALGGVNTAAANVGVAFTGEENVVASAAPTWGTGSARESHASDPT